MPDLTFPKGFVPDASPSASTGGSTSSSTSVTLPAGFTPDDKTGSVAAPSTTVGGLAGAATRGLALPAAGMLAGAAIGAPFGGVGAIPGALAGAGAAGLSNVAGDAYNAIARALHASQIVTPQEAIERLADKLGIKRPQSGLEKFTESTIGLPFMGAMAGETAAAKMANVRAALDSPQTATAARGIANQYYALANRTGGSLSPNITNKFVDAIAKVAPQTAKGKILAGETEISKLAQRAELFRDQPTSLQEVQEMDESLGDMIDKEWDPVKGGLSKEGRNLLEVQSQFRNMIADAGPGDVIGGSQGFEALAKGRQAWAQAAKMRDLERIATRATQTDNPATSVKSGIRVLTSNPTRARGYSKEELEALKQAGERGVLGNVLHVFGSRLGPWFAAGAGEAVGGPVGAVTGAAIGHGATTAARNLATRMQLGKLQRATSEIGKNVPPPPSGP